MDENTESQTGFAKVDAMADRPATTPPQPNDEPEANKPEPGDAVIADEPSDKNLSESDLRRNAIKARLAEVRAMASNAKRQNMLDVLADAVSELVTVMLDEMN